MLKKVIVLCSVILIASCDVANEVLTQLETVAMTPQSNQLTNDEVVGGLKEALTQGIEKAVDLTSITDGFNNTVRKILPWQVPMMPQILSSLNPSRAFFLQQSTWS